MTTTRLPWQPVQHPGRLPFVVCWRCKARELNETNRLHRACWEQVRWGRCWVFRCHTCSAPEGRGSDGKPLMPLTLPLRHTHLQRKIEPHA